MMTSSPETQLDNDPPKRSAERPLVVGYILKMFPRFSETFVLNEILELERQGVEVVVFSMKKPTEGHNQPAIRDLRARVIVVPPLGGAALAKHVISHGTCLLRSPKRYWSTLLFVYKRRTRSAWDKFFLAPFIVCTAFTSGVEHFHAHFASGPTRQAKFASMISGIPFSFTAHAKDLFWEGHQHGLNNKLKKRIRFASFVVTISEFNRRFILNQGFKVPRHRLVTIYNGLDLSKWPMLRPDGRPLDSGKTRAPLILAVGRLVPKKGFDVLVRACQILRGTEVGFHCVIAGEGPEKERIRDLIRELGLKDWVELAGPIPQDRLLKDYYMCASVLVQPSVISHDGDQDGIPTVILEALAIGLPVIATPVSGIGEVVQNMETGLIVQTDDSEALAKATERLLADPELAGCLAAKGRQLVELRHNLENNVDLLCDLMKLAARGGVRPSERKLRKRVGLEPIEEIEPGKAY